MIIAPMPSDRVKKEWPSASRIPSIPSSPKLGRKMKARASPEPLMPSALTSISNRMPNRIGRKMRAIFSIPLLTPK